ncbi:hypothetical protein QQ020_04185 [Fulvivirgaceae bacterium BMA12]|uniref:tRNA (5-methylaminomethyl-2-thiouridylate)-methyltransferase n=1 Tax=Agaribacillus aureus TaxID=3051825 RepID=A0ABT8L0L4_9BACT|nr:hypothetical protein [Fulvivirgaceae bacterium BMA12]
MTEKIKQTLIILKYTYGIVPIVAGLDKFTNLLTDWTQYVGLGMASVLPFEPTTFMMIVGVIEIAAGLLVLLRTNLGGLVVTGWLVAIAIILISSGHYIDIAIRDLVMAAGAYVLATLYEPVSGKKLANN